MYTHTYELRSPSENVRTFLYTIIIHILRAAYLNNKNMAVETAVSYVSTALGFFTVTMILVFIIVFLLVLQGLSYVRQPSGLPPGPLGLPLLGVIPFLGNKSYLTIQKWWGQYGDVYSIYMGSRLVVVLNGIEVMKECLVRQGDDFSARPWNYFKKLTRNTGKQINVSWN